MLAILLSIDLLVQWEIFFVDQFFKQKFSPLLKSMFLNFSRVEDLSSSDKLCAIEFFCLSFRGGRGGTSPNLGFLRRPRSSQSAV